MGGVATPGLVPLTPSCSVVPAVVAAEGEAGAELGTLGVTVETGAGRVFVAAVSDVAVAPVGGAGTAVESSVVDGTGAGVGAVTVLRSSAVGLVVLAVDTTVEDVVMAADGAPVEAVVLVDGRTVSVVTVRGVSVLGGEVVPGALNVISEVVEVGVPVGDVALVAHTCWVVVGDLDGDGVVVAVVGASTRPLTGRVVPVTRAQRVEEAGGALVELTTGGGVTNFLVVVAGISALETPAGDMVVVAVVSPGVDVPGRRDASVVEATRTLV